MILSMGLSVSFSGCSLRNGIPSNVPLSRLMIETDAPWCDIRPEHAGYPFLAVEHVFPTQPAEKWKADCCVKRRTEPCHIVQVLDVVAGFLKSSKDEIAAACYANAMAMFFPESYEQK